MKIHIDKLVMTSEESIQADRTSSWGTRLSWKFDNPSVSDRTQRRFAQMHEQRLALLQSLLEGIKKLKGADVREIRLEVIYREPVATFPPEFDD